MTATEKWNKICEYFAKYKNESEEKIQVLWEKLFSEIFGYSSLDDEIDSHRKIQLGSSERLIPDIIIKNSRSDLFIVELKREDLNVDDSRKKQLYSYLKQLRDDLGILICSQICIIDYDYDISDDNQKYCIIDFNENNPKGIKFVELFEKENFSKEAVKKFISNCIESSSKIKEIENHLNPDLIKNLLLNHFKANYSEEDIQQVLSKYDFLISTKQKVQTIQNYPDLTNYRIQQRSNIVSSEKTDQEKLIRDINSVGKETFIKYFEYYNNPNYETSDIKALFRKYENFSENSMASKASTGKGIIRRGNAKAALEIISNAANIDSSLREKAREYLSKL